MDLTRRTMLMATAAVAAVPNRTLAARRFVLDVVRKGFSLGLPERETAVPTRVTVRPRGFLIGHVRGRSFFGQRFADDGAPVGDRFKMLPDGANNPETFRSYSAPVCFDDGSVLVAFAGTLEGVGAPGVFARRVSAGGEKGPVVRLSGGDDDPQEAVATRVEGDAAIVAWRSKVAAPEGTAKLCWRVVGADGRPSTAIRTLSEPDGIGYQEPRGIVSLTGGGAALNFVRGPDAANLGDHFAQRLSSEGEASGRPMNIGPRETTPGLVGLSGDRIAAFRRRDEGSIDLTVFSNQGRAKSTAVVPTGSIGASSICAARPRGPGRASDGLALLIAGYESIETSDGGYARGPVVSLMLVNDAGEPIAKPVRIYEGPKSAFVVIGLTAEARHLVTLENGDLLAIHYARAHQDDATPPLASIFKIS